MSFEELFETLLLLWFESMWRGSERRKIASVMLQILHQMTCQLHEVMLDHSHDMEAVSDDSSVWKIAPNQAAIRAREIDANDLNLLFALEFFEKRSEFWSASAK